MPNSIQSRPLTPVGFVGPFSGRVGSCGGVWKRNCGAFACPRHRVWWVKNHTIDQILELPDVKERIDLYREHEQKFKEQVTRCAQVHQNLVFLDLTDEETIYAGNRFMIYALFPECNISIHKMWGFQKQNIVQSKPAVRLYP